MPSSNKKISIKRNLLFPSLIILGLQAIFGVLSLCFYNDGFFFFFCMIAVVILTIAQTIIILLMALGFKRSLDNLVETVKTSDLNSPFIFNKWGIKEIERVEDCFELLSREYFATTEMLADVFDNLHLNIATFNFTDDGNNTYCSSSIKKFMEIPETNSSVIVLEKEDFLAQLKIITNKPFRDYADVYQTSKSTWVRIYVEKKGPNNYGIIIDYTNEIEKQIRLEFERDSDLLTELSTRRFFEKTVSDKLTQVKNAALIMCDLDNLKAINDQYGHSCGDRYIRYFADLLRKFATEEIILCRRSGDEFFIYFPNIKKKDDAIEYTQRMIDYAKNNLVQINETTSLPLAFSAGIAFYPENGRTLEKLMHNSDLAMLSVKRSIKGNVSVYDLKASKEKHPLDD